MTYCFHATHASHSPSASRQRPDEFLAPSELRVRLDTRESELVEEHARVEAEAASILAELQVQIESIRQVRRELDAMEEDGAG